MEQRLETCLTALREKTGFRPAAALVLGTGLGDYAKNLNVEAEISYQELPGFPVSTAPSHRGRFLFGTLGKLPLVIMDGRIHYYEGYDMQQAVLPIRLMGLLGAKTLVLTNAAGCVNTSYHAGDLMMITDQIASFMPSPLRGPNDPALGVRFPDMGTTYTPALQEKLRAAAQSVGVTLREGVYLQLPGPQYESPAEIRMCRLLGADAVGMSTACEAIAARHMGMQIAGVSFLSNMAAGVTGAPLTQEEVEAAGAEAAPRFAALITTFLQLLEAK